MKVFLIGFFFLSLLVSCTRNSKGNSIDIGYNGLDSLKTIITVKEKNLKAYYTSLMSGDITVDTLPNTMINDLLKQYQVFYKSYPEDSLSPYYLDKIHQLFTQEKQYTYAVDWVDTLLYHYPNYRNKTLVLYSAATSSEMYLSDTNRVKRYYNRMLNECPKLKADVRKQITKRLRYMKMDYIDFLKDQYSLK